MSANLTIVSWCPGDPCDPCNHKHLYIIGNFYSTPNPTVYISYYAQGTGFITLSGTIIVEAFSKSQTQKYTLSVTVSGYYQWGSNALGTPLPATNTGIVIDASVSSYTMTSPDDVIVTGRLAPALYVA